MSTLQGYERHDSLSTGRVFDVYRATAPDGSAVVVKTPSSNYPEPGVLGRLRHEHDLLVSVSVPGVVAARGLLPVGVSLALVMDDAGAGSLGAAGSLTTGPFLRVALQLARALGELHAHGIIHRDVNPSNIVLAEVDGLSVATLVDFGLAVRLAAVPGRPQTPDRLEGTLPYLAPEQTGRTALGVDHRSDLYALGATYYTMLVGQPPFANQDPLELIHAHLARVAIPPHERIPDLAPTVSTIVMKLLEKAPEARYQTAEGLAHDLETALAGWDRDGRVPRFPLAQRDTPRAVRVPDRLYGREVEKAVLAQALSAAAEGRVRVVLISGAAGVGKSELARTLDPASAAVDARFCEGKFEALQRDLPFSALGRALGAAIQQLLAGSAQSVTTWQARLATLRAEAMVSAAVVPELHLLLGPLPEPPEVGAAEAAARLTMALCDILACLHSHRPMVLFLDDLQWADRASLAVLERVGLAGEGRLLLVGSWRPGEVGAEHALTATLRAWEAVELDVVRIELGPLEQPSVAQLVADALRRTPDAVGPLAHAIVRSTAGNPFFVRRLLLELCRRGVVHLDDDAGVWTWDDSALANLDVADNVADFMAYSLDRLCAQTRTVLERAAIMGGEVELGALAQVAQLDRSAVVEALWPAVAEGLLVPLNGAERLPRGVGLQDEGFAGSTASWRFIHDRVHEAALARIPESERPALHHRAGRALLDQTDDARLSERLFEVVDHLAAGRHCLVDDAGRREFIGLALQAGRRAVASASQDIALRYADAAASVLPSDATPKERFDVERAQATFSYLSGDHDRARIHLDAADALANTREERCALYGLRVVQATVVGDYAAALDWGRQGLSLLGHALPEDDLAAVTAAEQAALTDRLSDGSVDLLGLPVMHDPVSLTAMRLLSQIATPAYIAQPSLFALIPTRMALLSLDKGNAAQSAYAYTFCGMLCATQREDYALGHAMGTAGVALAWHNDDPTETCRTLHTFGSHVNHWGAHLRTSRPLLLEAHRAGIASGDLQFATYAYSGLVIHWYVTGVPLNDVLADCRACLAFSRRTSNQVVVDVQLSYRQAIRALQGATSGPTSMDEDGFDEAAHRYSIAERPVERAFYEVRKLELAYLHGDLDAAADHARRAHEGIAHAAGIVVVVELAFYEALTSVGLARRHPGQHAALLGSAHALADQFERWARAPGEDGNLTAISPGDRLGSVGVTLTTAAGRLPRQLRTPARPRKRRDRARGGQAAGGAGSLCRGDRGRKARRVPTVRGARRAARCRLPWRPRLGAHRAGPPAGGRHRVAAVGRRRARGRPRVHPTGDLRSAAQLDRSFRTEVLEHEPPRRGGAEPAQERGGHRRRSGPGRPAAQAAAHRARGCGRPPRRHHPRGAGRAVRPRGRPQGWSRGHPRPQRPGCRRRRARRHRSIRASHPSPPGPQRRLRLGPVRQRP